MIIGLDLGKKIGIAYAVDSMAMPYCVASSLKETALKIKEKRGSFLVVGLPLLLNGSEGSQCVQTKNMLNELLAILRGMDLNLEYYLQDERFSSKFMKHIANEHAHSAAWILQIYLDVYKKQG